MSRKTIAAFRRSVAGLVLCGSLAATGCGGGHEPSAPESRPAVRVETAEVRAEELPVMVEATGSVRPWVRVSPGTKIMGRIERVPVREGDRVRKGQLLASLEKRDLEAAVDQARAAVALSEADLENARAQYRRITQLHERGSATAKNLEDATSSFRVAEARVEQARASLAGAEATLSYAEIRSPVDGWVTAKKVEEGDMTSPGMSLFALEDTSRVKVVVELPESDVVGLAAGDHGLVRVDAAGYEGEAAIDRVLPAGDPASRTFQVQLVLENPEGTLRSGMFARALVERGSRQAVTVPEAAIVSRGQLQGVFVIDQQSRARLRWVRLGRSIDGRVEVLSGLGAGETILTEPRPGLADGAPVETR